MLSCNYFEGVHNKQSEEFNFWSSKDTIEDIRPLFDDALHQHKSISKIGS